MTSMYTVVPFFPCLIFNGYDDGSADEEDIWFSLKGLVKRKKKWSKLNYNRRVLNYAYETVLVIRK